MRQIYFLSAAFRIFLHTVLERASPDTLGKDALN